MGLDMYIYKASKPTEINDSIIHNYQNLSDKGYSMYDVSDVENEAWFAALMPFCVKVRCVAEYYDIARIAEAYELGENAHWCGFGPDGTYFIGSNKEVAISDEEVQKFCIEKEKEWYVTSIDEVDYWRKNYKLQEALYKAYNKKGIAVENCGYYKLDDEILEIIKKLSGHECNLDMYNTETLMYHEWY